MVTVVSSSNSPTPPKLGVDKLQTVTFCTHAHFQYESYLKNTLTSQYFYYSGSFIKTNKFQQQKHGLFTIKIHKIRTDRLLSR